MIRYGLGILAMAGGLLAAASSAQAQGASLTVPPDLRAPSEAVPPAAQDGKPRAAKAKKAKPAAQAAKERSLNVPGSSGAPSSAASQGVKREYPPDIDREAQSEARLRPSVSPSGRLGLGGRF